MTFSARFTNNSSPTGTEHVIINIHFMNIWLPENYNL